MANNNEKILGIVEIETPRATHKVEMSHELEIVAILALMDKCMDDFMDLSLNAFLTFYCCILDIWSQAHHADLLDMVDAIHELVHEKAAKTDEMREEEEA